MEVLLHLGAQHRVEDPEALYIHLTVGLHLLEVQEQVYQA